MLICSRISLYYLVQRLTSCQITITLCVYKTRCFTTNTKCSDHHLCHICLNDLNSTAIKQTNFAETNGGKCALDEYFIKALKASIAATQNSGLKWHDDDRKCGILQLGDVYLALLEWEGRFGKLAWHLPGLINSKAPSVADFMLDLH